MWKRALVGLMLCAPALAHAAEPLPRGLFDLIGPRGLAMGGAVLALGTSNDAIFVNPAGIAQVQRYSTSVQGLYDFNGGHESFGSILSDSSASSLAAGLAYDRVWEGPAHHQRAANTYHLALAYNLSSLIVLGATAKVIHYAGNGLLDARVTPDVGVLVRATPVNLAFVAYNLVDIHEPDAPRQYAVAVSVAMLYGFNAEADVFFDTSTHDQTTLKAQAGVEYQVMPELVLRAGYTEDRIRDQRSASGGVGVLISQSLFIDVGYQHEFLGARPGRTMMVDLGVNL